MKVLVVGSGGREHAIVWKLKQSPFVDTLFCAPGNGGISNLAQCINIEATDIAGMVAFAIKNQIDMTVVAPDNPLAMGMVDEFEKNGLVAFGPIKEAAMIESSKVFAKKLMRKYGIPTAQYEVFDSSDEAIRYVDHCIFPIVIKADGLAFGKGVMIAQSKNEAINAIHEIMVYKAFADAGNKIIIEEYIQGPEVSIMCFTDGKTILPMASAQDHKKIFDHDQGPNTGGMGAFSPSENYTPAVAQYVYDTILIPTMKAMASEGKPFKGVLYVGLMLTEQGVKVLEYNARFGDPEAQVILPRLVSDLYEIMRAIIEEKLHEISIKWIEEPAICVILSSGGYPGVYKTGYEIHGLNDIDQDILAFHSGTRKIDSAFYTNGGRVIGITATSMSISKAIEKAYHAISKIDYQDIYYRKDIGLK